MVKKTPKRPRPLSSTDDPNKSSLKDLNLEKVHTLWFDDGNVILATQTHMFRVHRSVLAQCSSVFRDKFSVMLSESQCAAGGNGAQAGSIAEYFDGALVLHSQDDWKDVKIFLMVCFDSRQVSPSLS